ncbi:MAG: hypothetical protein WC149_05325 [Arcobacteraceae bacterium]
MSDSFLRQRRNLMVMSIIVFVMSFGAIELDKHASIIGIQFIITNPLIIYITIFFMYIYFFIRYIQYYFELEPEYKDYRFYLMRWGGYTEHIFYGNKFIICLKVFYYTFIFIIENLLSLTNFIFHSLVRKDFSETFFPIVLAVLVSILSWNSEFIKSKKENTSKVFLEFYDKSVEMTYCEVKNYIDERISNAKKDIN